MLLSFKLKISKVLSRIFRLYDAIVTTKHIRLSVYIALILLLNLSAKLSGQEIKVMTYNIFHGEQHYSPGKSNLKLVAEVINQCNPDFVALQEVDSMTTRSATFHEGTPRDLIKELSEMTGMYGFFGKAIHYSNGGYGEGILSRFPAKSFKYSLPIPQGGEGRTLLMINYTLPDGKQIIFAGTHLCHQYDKNRLEQAKAICDIKKKIKLPMIMGGDFNFRPESEPYQVIMNCFKDAAKMKGEPKNTSSYENPRSRIDYIFVSGDHKWTIKEVEVIRVSASDHMPVLVTLELKE
jgi:endonuclease/exonuclease/phosphatase family metal-dependent hydrolase